MRVLAHAGVAVIVPPEQRGCGMEAIAQGNVETAREIARHNLRIFADLARDGYRIVCTEPTAAVMLRARLSRPARRPRRPPDRRAHRRTDGIPLGSARARANCRPIFARCRCRWGTTCRATSRHSAGNRPAQHCLGLIPERRVHTIDVSCSGMAGTYGLRGRGLRNLAGRGQADARRTAPARGCCSARRNAAPAGCRWRRVPANRRCIRCNTWHWPTG